MVKLNGQSTKIDVASNAERGKKSVWTAKRRSG